MFQFYSQNKAYCVQQSKNNDHLSQFQQKKQRKNFTLKEELDQLKNNAKKETKYFDIEQYKYAKFIEYLDVINSDKKLRQLTMLWNRYSISAPKKDIEDSLVEMKNNRNKQLMLEMQSISLSSSPETDNKIAEEKVKIVTLTSTLTSTLAPTQSLAPTQTLAPTLKLKTKTVKQQEKIDEEQSSPIILSNSRITLISSYVKSDNDFVNVYIVKCQLPEWLTLIPTLTLKHSMFEVFIDDSHYPSQVNSFLSLRIPNGANVKQGSIIDIYKMLEKEGVLDQVSSVSLLNSKHTRISFDPENNIKFTKKKAASQTNNNIDVPSFTSTSIKIFVDQSEVQLMRHNPQVQTQSQSCPENKVDKYVLVLDVETTGLCKVIISKKHKKQYYPFWQTQNYDNVRVLQLAYQLCKIVKDQEGKLKLETVYNCNHIINDKSLFPITNSEIHGIDEEVMQSQGINIKQSLDKLEQIIDNFQISFLVGHNINFDRYALASEIYRRQYQSLAVKYFNLPYFCTCDYGKNLTMLFSVFFGRDCKKLEGYVSNSYQDKMFLKPPTLKELSQILLQIEPQGLHNGANDVEYTKQGFEFMLQNDFVPVNF